MKNILILGASGQIAKHAIDMLLKDNQNNLTLFVRNPKKLPKAHANEIRVVKGDVLYYKELNDALANQEIIYANLAGEVDKQAKNIIKAMKAQHVKRLIFISALGIYDEVPGKFGAWNKKELGDYLDIYRNAAETIEASDLEYTIIRPAWLSDDSEVNYEITHRDEPFKGTEVSRKSIAALVVKLIDTPRSEIRESLGVNKPNTDGDKPSFF